MVMALLLFSFLILFVLLFNTLFYQLCCSCDLDDDHINLFDFASRMKPAILAEFIVQGLLCFLYLFTGHWFMTLLCVPYLYYNVRLYMRREHLIDVTEMFHMLNWKKIYNLLDWKKKERLCKFAHTLFLFLISLFWLIWLSLEKEQHAIQMVAGSELLVHL